MRTLPTWCWRKSSKLDLVRRCDVSLVLIILDREHQEEDDRALEKYHRDAAEGKHRVKRRGRGLDMDDSDDEDEDEEASRIRRQLRKKRKIEGDNLEALGL